MPTEVSFVEFEVPPRTLQVDLTGVASRAAIGVPTVTSTGGGTRNVQVAWAELEVPLAPGAVLLTSVASRAAVGTPEVRQPALLTGVASRAAIGTPIVYTGSPVILTGVASRAAVGVPSVLGDGVINGSGVVQTALAATINLAGVVSRRAVGTPTVSSTVPAPPSEVTVNLTGVASRQAVGTPQVIAGAVINLQSYGVLSRAAVGTPIVQSTVVPLTIVLTGVPSRRAFGNPLVTQVGGISIQGSGGPDDDEDTVGPHRVPKHLRKKKTVSDEAVAAAKEAAEDAVEVVQAKAIQPEAAPFPRATEQGVLVTPAMLEQIKQDALKAAKLAFEARQLKEGRLVNAAREYADQKAQQRAEMLAELAIRAAEEAEYEPAEREQVKEVEIEDPATGKPFKATIRTKVSA